MQPRSAATADPIAERYAALLELGRVLTGIVRPADLAPAIAERASRVLDAARFIVSRYDRYQDLATVTFGAGDAAPPGPTTYRGADCTAIREGRPVAYAPGDPPAVAAALALDVRDRPAIVAPILRDGLVDGSLIVIGRTGARYENGDLEFLAAAASLVAARSDGPPVAAARTDRLDEITRAIRAVSMAEAIDHITQSVADAAGEASVATWLMRGGGDLEAASTIGPDAPRKGTRVPLTHTLFRGLADRNDPLLITAGSELDMHDAFGPLLAGRATVIWPLASDHRVLGAVAAGWRHERDAERADVTAIHRLANLAGLAIAHGRLHDQIQALSLIDPLTGLANRRHLAMFLEKEFAAARRGRRLTLLLLDIDNFADYNRRVGRAAGDAALIACAEVIRTQTRAMNLAARYGADEFVVALADADRRAGFIHASRIAKAMGTHTLICSANLRMSVGIGSFSPRMAGFEDLVRAAFADLEARRKGGGRLTI